MRELRTEKPWRGNEGPGFKSRQLHFLHFPWSLMTGGFALSVQVTRVSVLRISDRRGLIPTHIGRNLDTMATTVSGRGVEMLCVFLQIVNEKAACSGPICKKRTVNMITSAMGCFIGALTGRLLASISQIMGSAGCLSVSPSRQIPDTCLADV